MGLSHAQANVLQRRKEKEEEKEKEALRRISSHCLSLTRSYFIRPRTLNLCFCGGVRYWTPWRETCSRCKSAHFFQPRRTVSRLAPHSSRPLGQKKKKRVTRWTEEEKGKKKKKKSKGANVTAIEETRPSQCGRLGNINRRALFVSKRPCRIFLIEVWIEGEKKKEETEKNLIHYSNWVSTATPGQLYRPYRHLTPWQ